MYSIEPILTWNNTHSFYTKVYGIESCHILSLPWCIMLLLPPDVKVMFDEHLLRIIIFVIPVIDLYIPFLCLWYQSYFSCTVFFLCGSSTPRGKIGWTKKPVFIDKQTPSLIHMIMVLRWFSNFQPRKYIQLKCQWIIPQNWWQRIVVERLYPERGDTIRRKIYLGYT